MRPYLSLIFPYGVVLGLLVLASLMFGADTPLMSYLFSGLLLLVVGAGMMLSRAQFSPHGAWIVLAGLGAFVGHDLFVSPGQSRFLIGSVDYVVLLAAGGVFIAGFMAGQKDNRVKPFWQSMMMAFLAMAVWAFVDFIVNPLTIHGQARPYHLDRLSAAFLSANTAATFFGMAFLAGASSVLRAGLRLNDGNLFYLVEAIFRHALLSLVVMLFAAVCLLLTASRAGVAFTLLGLLVLFGWEIFAARRATLTSKGNMLRDLLIGGFVVLLISIGGWVIAGDMAGARYGQLDVDASMRAEMFSAYWGAVQDRPFLGYGFGAFDAVNKQTMTADNAYVLATQGAAHNVILQWLLQVGWLGTGLMLGVFGVILLRLRRGLAQRKRHKEILRSVLVISLFISLHGMVDYALEIPGLMWWWALLLGFGCGIAAGGRGRAG